MNITLSIAIPISTLIPNAAMSQYFTEREVLTEEETLLKELYDIIVQERLAIQGDKKTFDLLNRLLGAEREGVPGIIAELLNELSEALGAIPGILMYKESKEAFSDLSVRIKNVVDKHKEDEQF